MGIAVDDEMPSATQLRREKSEHAADSSRAMVVEAGCTHSRVVMLRDRRVCIAMEPCFARIR